MIEPMTNWAWSWVVLALAAGAAGSEVSDHGLPGLGEEEIAQLATADDTRPPDEPALYPLLRNAAKWDPEAVRAAERSAATPDWSDVVDDAAAHRGEVVRVEGSYAGRQRRVELLRAGPWGEKVTEWGIVVGRGTAQERVVVVYLVNPSDAPVAPRAGASVRLVGRFFKTWTDRDAKGQQRRYPVVVARSASVVSTSSSGGAAPALVAAVVVLLAGLFAVRWWTRGTGGHRRQGARREGADRIDAGTEYDLPEDPAEALEQLERSAEG
ncbi:MAG: hypothetical protein AAFX76_10410 [Planctomycetota bacterium]